MFNKKSGLTITMIFNAQSLNYGEGIGNIAELKKLSRGNGKVYTFASRQALRYDIARLGAKMFGWNLNVVDKSKGTVQFKEKLSIKDSEEMDLFGYMKTKKGDDVGAQVRSAAVRISNAIALEDYKSDMELLTNKGLADRIEQTANLANVEQHLSYYTYTVTIDLDKVGIDSDGKIELDKEIRAKRVVELLEVLKVLNREIRGREENLSPLFVVGGLYNLNSPYFLGRIKLDNVENGFSIDTDILEDTMKLKVGENIVGDDTNIGIVKNMFKNEEEIRNAFENKVVNVQEFFDDLENKVKEFYK